MAEESLFAQRGPLMPATESSINAIRNVQEGCKKRKRDQHGPRELLQDSFVIHVGDIVVRACGLLTKARQAHQSSMLQRAQTLSPILLLPRSELPLAYLEPTVSDSSLSSARLFSANVPALDALRAAKRGAIVLIAKLETERSLYAVESVARGTYAVCKLANWLKIEELRAAASVARIESWPTRQDHGFSEQYTEWWRSAVSERTKEDSQRAKRRQITASNAVQLLMKQPKCRVQQQSPKASSPVSSPSQINSNIELSHAPDGCNQPLKAGPTAQETLEIIRTQYLEALHLSKTSLAYFAKGPLSRARAAYSTGHGTTMPLKDLIHSLRSSILTLPMMDKKYRETIPDLVNLIPAENISDGEQPQPILPEPRKRRKSRRTKPGKDGLHPNEEDYLSRGWRISHHESYQALPGEASNESINRRILRLRVRETELQIILILETLALESSASLSPRDPSCLTAVDQIEAPEGQQCEVAKHKSRKPQDLILLLDMLIDRLCIWQSLSNEEGGSASSKPVGNSEKPAALHPTKPAKNIVQHDMRDFCAEVVVPFYASRLPNQCAMINRKLGGRSGPSRVRPTLAKSLSASIRPLSGSGTASSQKDMQDVRPTLDLHSGTSDRQPAPSAQRPPPLLVRSVTAPAIPGQKREESEKPLSAVASKNPQLRPDTHGAALRAKRFTQREVDLSAVSNTNEAKLKKKKASIEEELKNAITALKRPNRGLAGRDLVDSAERRASAKIMGAKKAKAFPVRNPFAPGVQVTATPKGRRKKNMVGVPPTVSVEETSTVKPPLEFLLPSDHSILQSIARVSEMTLFSCSKHLKSPTLTQPENHHMLSIVQDTPSRGLSKSGEDAAPGLSVVQRTSTNFNFEEATGDPRTNKVPGAFEDWDLHSERELVDIPNPTQLKIPETPSKHSRSSHFHRSLKANPASAREQGGVANPLMAVAPSGGSTPCAGHERKSIYESLGWGGDDDVDDLI
ncbi:MAG: hypothetical protein M1812_001751 [Candelaria pacifica]|nr:MAG: hypothetical protein M1812_001751 [Candelaria pacifica]